MISTQQFRAGMARLGAAVNVIVTDGPAGRHGMTASAVCSVSDSPASLLVCINRSARIHALLDVNGRLSVNVLAGGQEPLSAAFCNPKLDTDARFAASEWVMLANGVPAMAEALVAFGCSVRSTVDMGTHDVFLCEVDELILGGDRPGLVYFDRSYHQLPTRALTA